MCLFNFVLCTQHRNTLWMVKQAANGSYRFAGLNRDPPHRVSSAVIAHRDWEHFAGAAGLRVLALV